MWFDDPTFEGLNGSHWATICTKPGGECGNEVHDPVKPGCKLIIDSFSSISTGIRDHNMIFTWPRSRARIFRLRLTLVTKTRIANGPYLPLSKTFTYQIQRGHRRQAIADGSLFSGRDR